MYVNHTKYSLHHIAEQSQQPLNYNKYSIHVKPVFKLLKSQRRKSQTPIASQSRAVFQHLTVTPVSSSTLWHFFDPGNIYMIHQFTVPTEPLYRLRHDWQITAGRNMRAGFFTPSADKGKECTILHQLCYTSLNVRSLQVDPADPPSIKQRLKN